MERFIWAAVVLNTYYRRVPHTWRKGIPLPDPGSYRQSISFKRLPTEAYQLELRVGPFCCPLVDWSYVSRYPLHAGSYVGSSCKRNEVNRWADGHRIGRHILDDRWSNQHNCGNHLQIVCFRLCRYLRRLNKQRNCSVKRGDTRWASGTDLV